MQIDKFIKSYWNYYLECEKRMEETKRYIEYDEYNFKTYSSNFLMLYQCVCSEIDVVGKVIASYFNPVLESEKGIIPINRWWFEIQDNLPDINREVSFAEAFRLKPWNNYRVVQKTSQRNSNGKMITVYSYNLQLKTDGVEFATPKWWNSYNKVKHLRLRSDSDGVNYKKANLQNLSNAFAALYLMEFEFMKVIGTTPDRLRAGKSKLFGMGDLENNYLENCFIDDGTLDFSIK